jgi:hypothetical protein
MQKLYNVEMKLLVVFLSDHISSPLVNTIELRMVNVFEHIFYSYFNERIFLMSVHFLICFIQLTQIYVNVEKKPRNHQTRNNEWGNSLGCTWENHLRTA